MTGEETVVGSVCYDTDSGPISVFLKDEKVGDEEDLRVLEDSLREDGFSCE
jgi:hypothetical protein